MLLSSNPLTLLLLLPWTILWLAGGLALARSIWRLAPGETWLVGTALGWVLQVWLANLLARLMPVAPAFWLSAGGVLLAGALALVRSGRQDRLSLKIPLLAPLVFLVITAVFYRISRGLAIFDDFQHLATISLMAAGDFPPHFALDPTVAFGYHHFLQLFSAELVRVGGVAPWAAVDMARALAFGLAVMLAAVYTRRFTGSGLAGLLGGLMIAFGSGTRWLLLFLPPGVLAWVGQTMQLIGSGAGSGANLPEALMNAWAVEGSGPMAFPFAFANGIFPAGVIQAHTANGLAPFVIIFLLLLTFNRWRTAGGAVVTAVLISVWGLLGEAELPGILLGWGAMALAGMLISRKLRLPRSLWAWLGIVTAGCMIGFIEGGALTDILTKALVLVGLGAPSPSYQTVGFMLAWPPAVVSSHLGVLSLFNPALLLAALLELGPVLLGLPLVAAWGWKAWRAGRWYEAGTAATVLGMLLMVFVQFTGSTGVRNTPRLYVFMPLLAALAVPLVWSWAARRSHGVQVTAAGLGLVAVTGGLVMFGISLLAAQRPVYSSFLTNLDARMSQAYWNRLAPGALVFDPLPYRAPAVLGRPTDAALTWYAYKPKWEALAQTPEPSRLQAAGFHYIYLDNQDWDRLSPEVQRNLTGACVSLVGEVSGAQNTFRRLLDISACR